MMSDMMRYSKKVIFFPIQDEVGKTIPTTYNLINSRNEDLVPETSTSPRSSGLPYSPFEQVDNEFIINSSLPSVESIGVRKSDILFRFKLDLCHVT